jgi:hypothetical protein
MNCIITKRILLLFALNAMSFSIFSQENTVVAGGDISSSSGNVSYSIGQAIYTTSSSTSGSLSQGVQQPYEIFSIVGVEDMKEITLEMAVFPNPVVDDLILKIDTELTNGFSYNLYDALGKLIENRFITSSETTISMSPYMSAVYLLKVVSKGKELKTFRIVKN